MNTNLILAFAVAGLVTAMKTDYNSFAAWREHGKDDPEPVKFDWKLALWRWGMGAVIGAGTGFACDQIPLVKDMIVQGAQ